MSIPVNLEVENLQTFYNTKEGQVKAVDGVSFKLMKGEMLGLIGESGCGKSTVALSLLNVIQPPGKVVGGRVKIDDKDLIKLKEKEIMKIRWKDIALIPQSAMNALNPVYKIGKQIKEAILRHENISNKEAIEKTKQLLQSVGIDEKWYDSYPHKLSGGMKQRVIIAMALACDPKVIISDESTTGLDVLIQAQILGLLKNLQRDRGLSIILISHDLLMVTSICERIGIMYAGKLVEIGSTEEIMNNPRHPYTKALLNSQIQLEDYDKKCKPIPGFVPSLVSPPQQCRFYTRCDHCMEECRVSEPYYTEVSENHLVACFLEGK
ncbi:ABC transporter ATP-binding protein [Wukongibacter baidiensis]|uniref:ABC transporter ATP-binding protein n=1 Tax=Wukongibacter baidiensis TaxID=1723361 RepID=UPI003D7F34FE